MDKSVSECQANEFRCADPPICVNEIFFCDFKEQCPDGSDEPEYCLGNVILLAITINRYLNDGQIILK